MIGGNEKKGQIAFVPPPSFVGFLLVFFGVEILTLHGGTVAFDRKGSCGVCFKNFWSTSSWDPKCVSPPREARGVLMTSVMSAALSASVRFAESVFKATRCGVGGGRASVRVLQSYIPLTMLQ